MTDEIGCRGHKSVDFHNPGDLVQGTQDTVCGGQSVQGTHASKLRSSRCGHFRSHLSGREQGSIDEGKLAGGEEQIPTGHRGDIRGYRGGHRGKGNPELCEPGVYVTH